MKTIILTVTLLLWMFNASSQKRAANRTAGFADLDSMAVEFIRCLKAGTAEVEAFCKRINLDSPTVEYLQKNHNYTPSVIAYLKKNHLDMSAITDNYCRFIYDFRETLLRRKHLESLEYVGREEKELVMPKSKNAGTETFFRFKAGDWKYKIQFGEMLRLNGEWKTWTEPYITTY